MIEALRRIAAAVAVAAVAALAAVPAVYAAPPYTANTSGTTLNGVLEALTDLQAQSSAFGPDGAATLAVTTASARATLPGAGTTILVWNVGASEAFYKLGNGTVTAATTDASLPAGAAITLAKGTSTDIAAITAAGSSTLRITAGSGIPFLAALGSGGAGSDNLATLAGFAINLGAGNAGTGTQRVIEAADSPLAAVLGTPASAEWTGTGDTDINGALKSIRNLLATNQPATVAHGSPDQGGSLKEGCVYRASPTAVDDGDRADALCDSQGRRAVTIAQTNVTADYDSGAGTVTLTMFGIALPASGGPVAGGTAANPLRVDPTGTTTQPISGNVGITGTVAATQSGIWSVRAQDGAGNVLTSAARGAERALSVQIVDGSGAQITSFGGSGGTASNYGSAFPSAGTAAGFFDGTNMQGARVFDADTGAGTEYVLGTNLRFSANGASVEAGTATNPIRIDPTGTTTQPVSGTVTANQGGTWTVQPGNTANTTAWLVTGTGGTFPATQSGTWNIANVSGTVSLPTGAATAANQTAVQGTVAPGTAAANSVLGGCVYNSTEPTPTTGQGLATQCDSKGRTRGVVMDAAGNARGANVNASNQLSVSVDNTAAANVSQIGGNAVLTGNGATGTGSPRVTIANDNSPLSVKIDQTTPGTTNLVAAGQNGTWTVQPGNTANTTPWLVSLSAPTAGGCTPGKLLSAASTNATSIKGSAGTLCKLTVINTTATIYYLKFYNTATAPTCNSSTVVATYPVPASTSGAGIAVNLGPYGEAYSTGIGLCLTGGLADNDNTSAATGVVVSYSYK